MQRGETPEVINVRAAELRKHGFQSLEQWLQDPNHVYIGRANPHVRGAHQSKWHNPFSLQKFGRAGCIKKFEEYILANEELLKDLPELKGKVLGCWCAPEACHGHVLSRLVAERVGGTGEEGRAGESEAEAPSKHRTGRKEAEKKRPEKETESKTAENNSSEQQEGESGEAAKAAAQPKRRRKVRLVSTA